MLPWVHIVTGSVSRQQGMFLMPTNNEISFTENIKAVFKDDDLKENGSPDDIKFEELKFDKFIDVIMAEKRENINIVKINISTKIRRKMVIC
jgi:hypothetical protein